MWKGPWNSLEVAKLIASVLTPISLAILGWFISRRMKRFEHAQWSNQKLIEKRLQLYDNLAPLLNRLLCFFAWFGYWQDVTPESAIEAKRELDKQVNIYRYLLSDTFYIEYKVFIRMLFQEYSAPGHDAKILSSIKGEYGDRREDCNYTWDPNWNDSFSEEFAQSHFTNEEIKEQYHVLMAALKDSIGLSASSSS